MNSCWWWCRWCWWPSSHVEHSFIKHPMFSGINVVSDPMSQTTVWERDWLDSRYWAWKSFQSGKPLLISVCVHWVQQYVKLMKFPFHYFLFLTLTLSLTRRHSHWHKNINIRAKSELAQKMENLETLVDTMLTNDGVDLPLLPESERPKSPSASPAGAQLWWTTFFYYFYYNLN